MLAYNLIVKLGRMLREDYKLAEKEPEEFLNCITVINNGLNGTKISEFLSVFPPIKRYANDGCWDYHSMNERIKTFGETIDDKNFKFLIMMDGYDNMTLPLLGLGFMSAINELNERKGNTSIMERFLYEKRLEKTKFNNKVKLKKHLCLVT